METSTMDKLRHEVNELVSEVKCTHRYSMTRIYGLYNAVFDTQETPQSCASCLIRKVKQLEKWIDDTQLADIQLADTQPIETKKKRKRIKTVEKRNVKEED